MSSFARPTAIVILAAGQGSRMKSSRPKPLHEVAGLSLLAHAMRAAESLAPARLVVVVGHGGADVEAAARAARADVEIRQQPTQEGTGHAVRCAWPALEGFAGDVVVMFADTPFVSAQTLARLKTALAGEAALAVLGFEAAAPGGYGRLIRDAAGGLARIVEAADASPEERAVTLCNSGVMGFDAARGGDWLARLSNDNAKGEYYLTDLAGFACADGAACAVALCPEAETLGVNSRADLAAAEAVFQRAARARAMAGGATLIAPETVIFSHDTELGRDVVVGPHVVFGPGARVADGATIRAFSHLEGCMVETGAVIGPYARLRPGARIGAGARIGNFVEVKNAAFAPGAKANHLAYIGDADVGAQANLGAGTITCNYDGFAKHRTEIGAEAFIGSNTALVAPVRIGARANTGAGSVITQDVEADALALGRSRQVNKPGLAARLRAMLSGTE